MNTTPRRVGRDRPAFHLLFNELESEFGRRGMAASDPEGCVVLPLALVAIHFVGDFVCQTDWMALNKSKRWDALVGHVSVYCVVLVTGLSVLLAFGLVPPRVVEYAVVNAVLHFLTDAVTSRINARLWFFEERFGIWERPRYVVPEKYDTVVNPWVPIDGKRHWFFVGIGADQLLHYAALFLTADWLLG